MDETRFKEALGRVMHIAGGIGTLGEKTLHSVLKYYFEPDASRHEVKVGGFVADILTEDGIIETRRASLTSSETSSTAFLRTER